MASQFRKSRRAKRWRRLQRASTNAWYAFVLAGTGAIAFSKTTSLTAIVVGGVLITLGFIMFVIVVVDFSEIDSEVPDDNA